MNLQFPYFRDLVNRVTYEERELLNGLARQEEGAFAQVFRDYYSALRFFAERITGDATDTSDIVTDVFGRLWEKRNTFDTLRHLKDFLYKATRNASLDHLKKASHSLERQGIFALAQPEWEAATDIELVRTEVYREIYREIDQLPDQCGRIIRMSYLDGKKNEDIAHELGLSIQTVKNQKSRGITLLKTRLPEELFLLFLLLCRLP